MLSNEEKRAIKGLEWSQQQMRLGNLPDYNQGHYADIRIVLNLIEKQSKEIEEYKKQLDLDNECEIALNSKVMDLEKEIEELKEESKEYQIGFAQGCYEKDLDWQDKIKAKIEEYEKMKEATKMDTTYYGEKRRSVIEDLIAELQSLLEKE